MAVKRSIVTTAAGLAVVGVTLMGSAVGEAFQPIRLAGLPITSSASGAATSGRVTTVPASSSSSVAGQQAAVATHPAAATSATTGQQPAAAPPGKGNACSVWTESSTDDDAAVSSPPLGVGVGPQRPPQLDLISETMAVQGSTLIVRIHVVDMEKQVSSGEQGDFWVTTWRYGSIQFSAGAHYSVKNGTSFFAGTDPAGGSGTGDTAVSGTLVTGAGGYAEIDVPLALVGNPPAGGILFGPDGATRGEIDLSSPLGPMDVQPGGDGAGPQRNYAVGVGCA